MKRYYIVINQVKVEIKYCKSIDSLGINENKLVIDFNSEFNKNDLSVLNFINNLYFKRTERTTPDGGSFSKSECVFDAVILEGDEYFGEMYNIQPLCRNGEFEWHLIFDFLEKKKRYKPESIIENKKKECTVACNVKKCFWLDEEDVAKLKKWQEKIKKKHKEYGDYTYMFSSGGGIGTVIKVKSELTGEILDLTDINKW